MLISDLWILPHNLFYRIFEIFKKVFQILSDSIVQLPIKFMAWQNERLRSKSKLTR